MAKTILAFCANEQSETEHGLDVDGAGEVVLTCACGRFLKYPKGTDAAALKDLLAAHKEANGGQISQASIDEAKEKLLNELSPDETE